MILLLLGCVELDFVAFNGLPCAEVDEVTCDNGEWDSICLSCEQPYVWDLDYPWFDTMLEPGQSVRPIDGSTVRQVSIPTADGEGVLDAYFIPSHGGDAALASTTLFYNHGNFAGIEHYIPRLRVLHELGYNLFVWDYRGYGKSLPASHPTPRQFLDDARIAFEYAAAEAPDATKVIPYGYSLGGVPAVESAVQVQPCALFLEAPFTSFEGIARAGATMSIPDSYLTAGLFDNQHKILGYGGPLLAMVGSEDGRFVPDEVARIVENAPGHAELWVLDGVEHGISNGGVVEAGMNAYGDRMKAFLEAHAASCL